MDATTTAFLRWLDGHRALAALDKVFVFGCAKSGTTWLMNSLHGHPELCVMGEGGFAWRLAPLLLEAMTAFNRHQDEHRHSAITKLRDGDMILALRAVVDGQFARYVDESGKDPARLRVVGDKTPQHTGGIPVLRMLYPDARFVHVIRDPRDVATSAWFHFGKDDGRPFEEYVRDFITQAWGTALASARQAAAGIPDQCLEVRYEDLHAEEVTVLGRICRFLGVDDGDAAIASCVSAGDFRRRTGGRGRGAADNASFYRKGVVGDWRNHIAPDLAAACCAEIAPLLESCGYAA